MADDAQQAQELEEAQAAIAKLQQQVATLLAAVQANVQAAHVPPVPPAVIPPPVFALSPARVTADPINYTTNTGAKIYAEDIAPLPQKFDLTTGKLTSYGLQGHSRRATCSSGGFVDAE